MKQEIKIAILADAGSTHTVKWVNALSDRGLKISLISLRKPAPESISEAVNVYVLENQNQKNSDLLKLSYLTQARSIKKIVKEISPDILHAFYATSYGTLGRYCKHPKYIISVWGSDVYEFPIKSPFHKYIIQRNLSSAIHIFSTSEDMMRETKKYTKQPISVIPFGVDVEFFVPKPKNTNTDELVFGTVKTMEHVYGIDILIRSFAKFKEQYSGKAKLLIAGSGGKIDTYKKLANDLGVGDQTKFLGYIPQSQVPTIIQQMDVFMVLSRRESFGVAAVEAAACGIPVIATNTGGLPEVVIEDKTGFIVPVEDVSSTVDKMKELTSAKLRESMGKEGRNLVLEKYNWKQNVDFMVENYKALFQPKD